MKVRGKIARIQVDLKPGRRRITVIARDLAGNVTKKNFVVQAVNKVLELDGRSAVLVALPASVASLKQFTVECWVRGRAANGGV